MRSIGKSLIVVLGPTAVGKTGLAIDLAKQLEGEIIGADSRQIYRFMDVGTAKPTSEQQKQVPHHLLNIVDPDQKLSVAQYQRRAYDIIDEIHSREHIPIVVGGTGQYISAVTEGWSIPEVPPNEDLRTELETFASTQGSEALHKRLAKLDPVAAQAIDHRNIRRVVRALEVCIETHQPISQLQQKQPPPYRILYYGLTLDRDRLYEQADRRVDEMMEAGFLAEVESLLNMGYDRRLPSMSGLGYAQFAAHLLDGVALDTAIVNTKYDTHDFIRRQYTWFRGHDPGILWHNMEHLEKSVLIKYASRWLQEQI